MRLMLRLMTALILVSGVPSALFAMDAACIARLLQLAKRELPEVPVGLMTFEGQYQGPLKLMQQLSESHRASDKVAAATVFTPLGSRALANWVLAREGAETEAEKFAKSIGVSPSEVKGVFGRASGDPVIVSLIAKNEAFFRLIFEDEQMRDYVNHNPYLAPGAFHLLSGDASSGDCCFTKMTEGWPVELIRQVAAAFANQLKKPDTRKVLSDLVAGESNIAARSETSLHTQTATTFDQLYEAIAKSDTFRDLDGKISRVYQHHFDGVEIEYQGSSFPFLAVGLGRGMEKFQLGMILLVKGQEKRGITLIQEQLESLREQGVGISEKAAALILDRYRAAARDPQMRALTWGQFAQNLAPSPEALLLKLLTLKDLPNRTQRGMEIPALMGRPQQLEMIKAVIQYTFTVPGESKMLEVGYGVPVVPAILKHYLPGVQMDGVDTAAPDGPTSTLLKSKLGIELAQQDIFAKAESPNMLTTRGPYTAIYAVDVLRASYGGLGRDFKPGVPPAIYLKRIHDGLQPGGVFLVLNDNKTQPTFTKEQAEAAGFEVVRWAEARDLPAEQKALFAAHADPTVGNMVLFALRRKGETQFPAEIKEASKPD